MNIYDLTKLELDPNAGGNCGAFYQNDLINARLIVLKAGQKIPNARVDSYVLFYVVAGEVFLTCNEETVRLQENQVFISGPATLSLETAQGARLMGVRISMGAAKP
ncbi:MAG: AraC family ligand binding domain-containing protein [Christensenellales bacterium]